MAVTKTHPMIDIMGWDVISGSCKPYKVDLLNNFFLVICVSCFNRKYGCMSFIALGHKLNILISLENSFKLKNNVIDLIAPKKAFES